MLYEVMFIYHQHVTQIIAASAKLKHIGYSVVARKSNPISTAVAPAPHDYVPRSPRPLGRSVPSTAPRYAHVRQHCDRTVPVPAASMKNKISVYCTLIKKRH